MLTRTWVSTLTQLLMLLVGLSTGGCDSLSPPGHAEALDVPAATDGQAGAGAREQPPVEPTPIHSAAGDIFQVRVIEALPVEPARFRNDWLVEVVDADGTPAPDVRLVFVQPFMPTMLHDGLRDPTIERLDAPGRFQVDDINLWMAGEWEVRFDLQRGGIEERVAIELNLGFEQ